jgi:ADP-ribose pyrophosphatase YjhB (NUDIX family)
VCEACGAEHWRDVKACANAIVARPDGRILLTRRACAPWRGLWCAPGGFAEPHEPPEETARREAREETGLEIRVTQLLGIWVDAYGDDPRDADADWISVAYFAAEADGEALAADPAEVLDARWFAPDELPDALAPPGTLREVLAAWEAGRRDAR